MNRMCLFVCWGRGVEEGNNPPNIVFENCPGLQKDCAFELVQHKVEREDGDVRGAAVLLQVWLVPKDLIRLSWASWC